MSGPQFTVGQRVVHKLYKGGVLRGTITDIHHNERHPVLTQIWVRWDHTPSLNISIINSVVTNADVIVPLPVLDLIVEAVSS